MVRRGLLVVKRMKLGNFLEDVVHEFSTTVGYDLFWGPIFKNDFFDQEFCGFDRFSSRCCSSDCCSGRIIGANKDVLIPVLRFRKWTEFVHADALERF